LTYNGWTNYETWLTNLHFDDFTDAFSEMTEDGQFDDLDDDDILDQVAEYIETFIDDYISEVVSGTDNFVTDIITSFTQEVDYRDIAEHYVDDIKSDLAERNKEAS
jgi:hypothetical protein